MIVMSHRGYWKTAPEKNSAVAFERSFGLAFGTETDVRDCMGELVISHDMPQGGEMKLDEFLDILAQRDVPLAINIKSDGLAAQLAQTMRRRQVRDWFVFDMAVPDMRAHLEAGTPVFTRMSEVEQVPAYLEQASGVWLDMFSSQWYDSTVIEGLLSQGKRVCVVSPELHGKDPASLWASLRGVAAHPGLMLCTDEPELARSHFSNSVARD
jgi:glycerophosphoryl diester phosphodiesterase